VSDEHRHTAPQPFRRSLEMLLDDLDAAPVRETTSLLDRWPDIVGRDLAAHTEPLGVRRGVLLVEADDPAYGEALSWNERQVLTRLAADLGEGVVTAVQVRTRRSRG
jgi:predicted nucleic acid-binding Zn ribbon protein